MTALNYLVALQPFVGDSTFYYDLGTAFDFSGTLVSEASASVMYGDGTSSSDITIDNTQTVVVDKSVHITYTDIDKTMKVQIAQTGGGSKQIIRILIRGPIPIVISDTNVMVYSGDDWVPVFALPTVFAATGIMSHSDLNSRQFSGVSVTTTEVLPIIGDDVVSPKYLPGPVLCAFDENHKMKNLGGAPFAAPSSSVLASTFPEAAGKPKLNCVFQDGKIYVPERRENNYTKAGDYVFFNGKAEANNGSIVDRDGNFVSDSVAGGSGLSINSGDIVPDNGTEFLAFPTKPVTLNSPYVNSIVDVTEKIDSNILITLDHVKSKMSFVGLAGATTFKFLKKNLSTIFNEFPRVKSSVRGGNSSTQIIMTSVSGYTGDANLSGVGLVTATVKSPSDALANYDGPLNGSRGYLFAWGTTSKKLFVFMGGSGDVFNKPDLDEVTASWIGIKDISGTRTASICFTGFCGVSSLSDSFKQVAGTYSLNGMNFSETATATSEPIKTLNPIIDTSAPSISLLGNTKSIDDSSTPSGNEVFTLFGVIDNNDMYDSLYNLRTPPKCTGSLTLSANNKISGRDGDGNDYTNAPCGADTVIGNATITFNTLDIPLTDMPMAIPDNNIINYSSQLSGAVQSGDVILTSASATGVPKTLDNMSVRFNNGIYEVLGNGASNLYLDQSSFRTNVNDEIPYYIVFTASPSTNLGLYYFNPVLNDSRFDGPVTGPRCIDVSKCTNSSAFILKKVISTNVCLTSENPSRIGEDIRNYVVFDSESIEGLFYSLIVCPGKDSVLQVSSTTFVDRVSDNFVRLDKFDFLKLGTPVLASLAAHDRKFENGVYMNTYDLQFVPNTLVLPGYGTSGSLTLSLSNLSNKPIFFAGADSYDSDNLIYIDETNNKEYILLTSRMIGNNSPAPGRVYGGYFLEYNRNYPYANSAPASSQDSSRFIYDYTMLSNNIKRSPIRFRFTDFSSFGISLYTFPFRDRIYNSDVKIFDSDNTVYGKGDDMNPLAGEHTNYEKAYKLPVDRQSSKTLTTKKFGSEVTTILSKPITKDLGTIRYVDLESENLFYCVESYEASRNMKKTWESRVMCRQVDFFDTIVIIDPTWTHLRVTYTTPDNIPAFIELDVDYLPQPDVHFIHETNYFSIDAAGIVSVNEISVNVGEIKTDSCWIKFRADKIEVIYKPLETGRVLLRVDKGDSYECYSLYFIVPVTGNIIYAPLDFSSSTFAIPVEGHDDIIIDTAGTTQPQRYIFAEGTGVGLSFPPFTGGKTKISLVTSTDPFYSLIWCSLSHGGAEYIFKNPTFEFSKVISYSRIGRTVVELPRFASVNFNGIKYMPGHTFVANDLWIELADGVQGSKILVGKDGVASGRSSLTLMVEYPGSGKTLGTMSALTLTLMENAIFKERFDMFSNSKAITGIKLNSVLVIGNTHISPIVATEASMNGYSYKITINAGLATLYLWMMKSINVSIESDSFRTSNMFVFTDLVQAAKTKITRSIWGPASLEQMGFDPSARTIVSSERYSTWMKVPPTSGVNDRYDPGTYFIYQKIGEDIRESWITLEQISGGDFKHFVPQTNVTSSGAVTNVTLSDVLPKLSGFVNTTTFRDEAIVSPASVSLVLENGVLRVVGASSGVKITIVFAGITITITFVANSSDVSDGSLSELLNGRKVYVYTDSVTSTLKPGLPLILDRTRMTIVNSYACIPTVEYLKSLGSILIAKSNVNSDYSRINGSKGYATFLTRDGRAAAIVYGY